VNKEQLTEQLKQWEKELTEKGFKVEFQPEDEMGNSAEVGFEDYTCSGNEPLAIDWDVETKTHLQMSYWAGPWVDFEIVETIEDVLRIVKERGYPRYCPKCGSENYDLDYDEDEEPFMECGNCEYKR